MLILLLSQSACSEIFELDITTQVVQLLAPADSTASRKTNQTFRWEATEGARSYQLQVASPSMAAPEDFFVDTTVTQLSARLSLPPGRFQWRVRALNAGYQSAFGQTRNLRIDSSASLAEQEFRLISPANNASVATNKVLFQWESLPMADRYILRLLNTPYADTVYTNQFEKLLPEQEGSYQWRVTALNQTSRVESLQAFTFTVQEPAPVAPTLVSPADQASFLSQPIALTWQRNGNDIARDSLFLYTANQTIISGFPRAINGETYNLEFSTIALNRGTYYWALRSVNAKGKASPLSVKRSFIIL